MNTVHTIILHTLTLSVHHTLTLSVHHTLTLSVHHTLTLSVHHTLTLSIHHTISPSHPHTISPSHPHTITPHSLVVQDGSVVVDGERHGADCGDGRVPLQLVHQIHRQLTGERVVDLGKHDVLRGDPADLRYPLPQVGGAVLVQDDLVGGVDREGGGTPSL